MTDSLDEQNGPRYPTRAVVDTCVLLNIALGKNDNGDPDWLSRSEQLIDDAINGKLILFMPSVALVELSTDHILRAGNTIDKNDFRKMKNLAMKWCMNCSLPIADLTRGAAQWFNKTYCVQNIRTADACILATAHYAKAKIIYTWDDEFRKKVNYANNEENIGITAEKPPELVHHLFTYDPEK